ncbi:Oligosaccaryltransferase [Penicillium brevicompactum]|uniref:Dolichyl-diphosphooligosaccharide--protein glycosyltransferase subunit 4 n=1 Tax=Penicillium brevicompactum TaxID=5074 RepID=A0A9W9V1H3_PENBR|nr:Oligosaccaryltransferase [Penicillium brevicompactum]KAJ5333722.1 Oligosaccaryltransferase [Penicillium brevicompactum]KAJ5362711.1 Oligosaccaryltransferase [Penicillium brevicompactum]
MISDDDLYRLAIFLGSCAMMMIVLYHFLDVNSSDESADSVSNPKSSATTTSAEVSTSGNGN